MGVTTSRAFLPVRRGLCQIDRSGRVGRFFFPRTVSTCQLVQRVQMEAEQSADTIPHGDPIALFDAWYQDAWASEPNDANAMALATATPSALPSVRMVLLKGHDPEGFTFYTNSHSRKGQELLANPNA